MPKRLLAFLYRHPVLNFVLMAGCFLLFGLSSVNLFVQLNMNIDLFVQYGWQVVEDGALPSRTMDIPTIPSLPMVATSTMLPSSSTVRIGTSCAGPHDDGRRSPMAARSPTSTPRRNRTRRRLSSNGPTSRPDMPDATPRRNATC